MDAINSITGIMGKISPLLSLGMAGAGTAGNIMGNRLNQQPLEQQLALQRKYANMTPDQFAAGIQSFLRPMSGALTSSVGNTVQGALAERGLSEAPGVYADTLSQSLAPFQTQLQQQAINAYFQSLGLPVEAAARFLPGARTGDTASLWQNFFRSLSPQMQGLTFANPRSSTGGTPGTPFSTDLSGNPNYGTPGLPAGAMDINSTMTTPGNQGGDFSDTGTIPFDWTQVAAAA